MTRRSRRGVVIHATLAAAALGLGLWLLGQAEQRMGRLAFLLVLYALGEAAWAVGAVWNQRDYARHPRRPIINEIRGVVGGEGIVTRACNPRGQVRVDGDVWQAEVKKAGPIPEGAAVTITGYSGLVLEVERVVHVSGERAV